MKPLLWVVAILAALYYLTKKFTVPQAQASSANTSTNFAGLFGFGSASPPINVAPSSAPTTVSPMQAPAIGAPPTIVRHINPTPPIIYRVVSGSGGFAV